METLPDAGSYTEEPDDEMRKVFNGSVTIGAFAYVEQIMARRHMLTGWFAASRSKTWA